SGSEMIAKVRRRAISSVRVTISARFCPVIELALVRNLAGINRVRQRSVEMPAREGFAAAFGAARYRAFARLSGCVEWRPLSSMKSRREGLVKAFLSPGFGNVSGRAGGPLR